MKLIIITLSLGLISFAGLCQAGSAGQSGETPASRPTQPGGSLGKLKENESITVYFSSFGCFSQTGRKLVLTRSSEGVRAVLYNGRITYPSGSIPTIEQGKQVAEKLLDADDELEFAAFETELSRRRDGGCTTIENYTMVSNYGSLSVSDGSCNWFGFTKLSQDLFGTVKMGELPLSFQTE